MGKATNRKLKVKQARDVGLRCLPTAEAQQHATYVSAGMATRRVPVIDTMLTRSQITDAEYTALAWYRDQAHIAERSPLRSCLDREVRGSGDNHPSAAITSAVLTTARIERELGSLLDIARAVAVEDVSLSQWCVAKFGGRERYNDKGAFVAVVPINEKRHMAIAQIDLRMAARRIMAA